MYLILIDLIPRPEKLESPFPFFVQAHLHHYTQVDGMELDQFAQSLESLNSIVCEYESLEASMGRPIIQVPRLKIA